MLELFWGIIKVFGGLLLQLLFYVGVSVMVNEVTSKVLLSLLDFVGSTAFIFITFGFFIFGYCFFWLVEVDFQNWNVRNEAVLYIWNRCGGVLLIGLILGATSFLITTVSFCIEAVGSSHPQILLFLGVLLFLFILTVLYSASKSLKN